MFVVGVGLVKVYSVSVTQLCDPMDCSLPGSSAHGIFQAKILECVAISLIVYNSPCCFAIMLQHQD